jgi:hypothetical protein
MPPNAVKTIKDLIFWQYAKLISKSAGFGINERAFQMSKFKELQEGKIIWSTNIREWIKEHENPNECIYCGIKQNLTIEHILPTSRGGPNTSDNTVWICKSCNSKKGDKGLYEYFGLENKDKIPRIAEGKYLKLLYKIHEEKGSLDYNLEDIKQNFCAGCILKERCKKEGTEGKLTVWCLEGCLK